MAKAKRSKRGFTFEEKIDLSQWDFNRIADKEFDARMKVQQKLGKYFEKSIDEYLKKLGPIEDRIRKIASEAMQITFEKEVSAGFWDMIEHPELMSVGLRGITEDNYSVMVNINEVVEDTILGLSDDDGYVEEEFSEGMLKFSEILDRLAKRAKAAVRPK